jgi:hypothetical protein
MPTNLFPCWFTGFGCLGCCYSPALILTPKMARQINQVTPGGVAFVPTNTSSQKIENDHRDQNAARVAKAVDIKLKNCLSTENRDARRV